MLELSLNCKHCEIEQTLQVLVGRKTVQRSARQSRFLAGVETRRVDRTALDHRLQHGRPVVVVMAVEEFDRLKGIEGQTAGTKPAAEAPR